MLIEHCLLNSVYWRVFISILSGQSVRTYKMYLIEFSLKIHNMLRKAIRKNIWNNTEDMTRDRKEIRTVMQHICKLNIWQPGNSNWKWWASPWSIAQQIVHIYQPLLSWTESIKHGTVTVHIFGWFLCGF